MPFRLNKTYGVLLLFGGDAIKAYENGNAETKDNTVCTVWQKKEGTFHNSKHR